MPFIDPYDAPVHVQAALEYQAAERGVTAEQAVSVARLWETLRMETLEDKLASADAVGVQMLDAKSHEAIFDRCEEVAREVCVFLRGLFGIPIMMDEDEDDEENLEPSDQVKQVRWWKMIEEQLAPQVRSRVGVRIAFALIRSLRISFEPMDDGTNARLEHQRFETQLHGPSAVAGGVGYDEEEERRRRAIWMLDLIMRVDQDRPAHPHSLSLADDERRMVVRHVERVAAGGGIDSGSLTDLEYVFEKVQPDWHLYAEETGRDEVWERQRARAVEIIEGSDRERMPLDDVLLLDDLKTELERAREDGRDLDKVLPNATLSTVLRISLGTYDVEPHEELKLPEEDA